MNKYNLKKRQFFSITSDNAPNMLKITDLLNISTEEEIGTYLTTYFIIYFLIFYLLIRCSQFLK